MDLKEFISKRKSVRKYKETLLSGDTLAQIKEFADNATPLVKDIKISMEFLKDVKNILPVKSPHYISFYSEVKEGYIENAGFILAQIDLYLSSIGLGSCYLGMAKPSEKQTKNCLEFIIILGFGEAAENVHRANTNEFRRKAVNEVANIQNEHTEAVRLSASASNGQPWYVQFEEGKIHLYCEKHNVIKALLYERMNNVDMGIVMCNLWLSYDKKLRFEKVEAKPMKGYLYSFTATEE